MKKLLVSVFIFNLMCIPVYSEITDDFVMQTLDKNLKIREYKPVVIKDDFAESLVVDKKFKKRVSPQNAFNILRITPEETISTKKLKTVGGTVVFRTTEDAVICNKTYKTGTKVEAIVENISKRAFLGVPADIVVGRFSINGEPLAGEISKSGTSRVLWVKPLSVILTPFGGAGIGLMFIKGGHATIKKGQIYTVYYE